MLQVQSCLSRIAAVAALAVLILPTAPVQAQGSGTLLSQTVTHVKGPTDPTISFRVDGFKGAGSSTLLFIEIGPDGNSALPAPSPALPASARFIVRKGGVAAPREFTPPASGSVNDNDSTFPGKNVSLDRIVENATDPRGLFRLIVGHIAEIPEGASETWNLEITGIPAGLRVIGSIQKGALTDLVPAPSPCGGGTCPPAVCPLGEACRPPCPFGPCVGPFRLERMPVITWPPGPGPVCLSCPLPWREPFDGGRFERILVTFVPTADERLRLEQSRDLRFNVTGGQLIGDVLEGSGGEFMQMVQYPRGQPPTVAVAGSGTTLAEFRAEPPASAEAEKYRKVSWLLSFLLLLALL